MRDLILNKANNKVVARDQINEVLFYLKNDK